MKGGLLSGHNLDTAMALDGTVFCEMTKPITALLKHMAILRICRPGIASLVMALGVVSGCTLFQPQASKTAQPDSSATGKPSQSGPTIPPVPPAKPPVASSAQLDPQRLVGLDESGVTDLIGAPQETREEAPARVWHYIGDKCSVDVLFYFDLTKQQFRALTYRVEPAGKSDLAQRICLGGIQEAQRGGSKR